MTIPDIDIKKLWGLAAGTCSKPDCKRNCIPFLNEADPTVVGEMAHVVARKPRGPRGGKAAGEDKYDNLILLCPTCHTEVDRAPSGTFDETTLHKWKAEHEADVRSRMAAPIVTTKRELADRVLRLLADNYATWTTYGPESAAAKANPLSSASRVWGLRKLAQVIPRNSQIVALIQTNAGLLSASEYEVAVKFVEHAAGFESSAYDPVENVPRFPVAFEEMMRCV